MELEAGKLYQVKHYNKGWIIAEYVKEIAAHSYKYHSLNMNSLKTGKEQTRHVPLSHQWKTVRSTALEGYSGSYFTLTAKGMDVRPVTSEALETIAQLKTEIRRLDEESQAKKRELREFCE